jgi:peptidoglycan hydrolase CwlO-like protein
MTEVIDLILRFLAVFGIPAILMFWLRDRRRVSNLATKEEKQLPYEVRATAATTLDAELAALTKSFNTDREIKDRTITELKKALEEKEVKILEQSKRIEELQKKVDELQKRVYELQEALAEVSRELAAMHDMPT